MANACNTLGGWTPETDEQRTQRYCAEQIAMAGAQHPGGAANQAVYQDYSGYVASMQFFWVPPRARRPRNIDPKSKLTDRAARLLAANHCLVQS